MGELILIILIIALITVVCWPNLKWWYELYIKPSVVQDFPEKHPPFCFECNAPSCKGCKAHQAYLKDPAKGWDEWYNMKHSLDKNFETIYKGKLEVDK